MAFLAAIFPRTHATVHVRFCFRWFKKINFCMQKNAMKNHIKKQPTLKKSFLLRFISLMTHPTKIKVGGLVFGDHFFKFMACEYLQFAQIFFLKKKEKLLIFQSLFPFLKY